MSSVQPNLHSPDRMVRVEVIETVDQVNARGPMTADRFLEFAANNGRCELLKGKVRMMSPAGSEHGYIANQIAFLLTAHVRSRKLGRVYAAETGFILERSPDTVRAPDIAFIQKGRIPATGEERGFGQTVPDLVVEVISPNDQINDVAGKTAAWLPAGVRCVVKVDPKTQAVAVHRSENDVRLFVTGDVIELSDVVPGWNPTVFSFFETDD